MTHPIHEQIDEALRDAEQIGHVAGVKDGRAQTAQEATALVHQERDAILEQGREQGKAEAMREIEAQCEEARKMGVEEGRASGKMTADKQLENKAYAKGKTEGDAAGYKRGRGDGYRNGWNDCIDTPPAQQKPR